ncbi:hypothetical protein Slin15195_G129740 [Septoria linicola]|uniref:Uncharacterized protein n=1 Tax=Septoria linicola TaxID=215465 RepID=A0A9Q9ER04_9PEZI|nr:hypothetical protein Slin14017_G128750 [Septoria linicola]USW59655.1 hypothetical protein Slin15195_G129740 [Septoria linicola]
MERVESALTPDIPALSTPQDKVQAAEGFLSTFEDLTAEYSVALSEISEFLVRELGRRVTDIIFRGKATAIGLRNNGRALFKEQLSIAKKLRTEFGSQENCSFLSWVRLNTEIVKTFINKTKLEADIVHRKSPKAFSRYCAT